MVGPDVGGGFGVKDHLYEDEALVCLAALELGRPVKWIEDRRESLTVTAQARDHVMDVEVAYANDGTLLGLRTHGVRDTGATFSVFGPGPAMSLASNLPGPYRWQAVRTTGPVVVTNKVPLGAYRGFGQPQAAQVRERAVELVADRLGMDPVELRLQNMLGPEDLPFQSRTLLTYDTGDYPASLRRAAELIRSGPEPPDDGRARGIGFSCYCRAVQRGPGGHEQAARRRRRHVRDGHRAHGAGRKRSAHRRDQPYYALKLDNVAGKLPGQGEYAKAEPLYRQALAITRRCWGDHPAYATSLNNLAGLYQGRVSTRRPSRCTARPWRSRGRRSGEDHPDTARSLQQPGHAVPGHGGLREGRATPPPGPGGHSGRPRGGPPRSTPPACNNLALLYQHGRVREGRAAAPAGLEMYRKALRGGPTRYATSLNNLARLYLASGEYAKAEPLYRQALEVKRTAAGEGPPGHCHRPEQPGPAVHGHGGVRQGRAGSTAGAGDQ